MYHVVRNMLQTFVAGITALALGYCMNRAIRYTFHVYKQAADSDHTPDIIAISKDKKSKHSHGKLFVFFSCQYFFLVSF